MWLHRVAKSMNVILVRYGMNNFCTRNISCVVYSVILYPLLQSQLVEMEGEVTRANSLLRQKEREVEQVSQVASKLTNERDNVADVVRQEFADR